jgi:hypothetical protein
VTDKEIDEWIGPTRDERLRFYPEHFGKGEWAAIEYLKAYAARNTGA